MGNNLRPGKIRLQAVSALGFFMAVSLAAVAPAADEAVVHASAKILPAQGSNPPRLQVAAKINDGWHIYSITQKPGGPVRTKIKLGESSRFKIGEFKAITPPASHPEPDFDNLIVEEHSGEAVWEAPLSVSGPITDLKITGAVNAQACSNACLPPTDYKFETVGDGKK